MTTDPKIYTAAEVASAGLSKEEIEKSVAKVTQKAHEAARSGDSRVIYYNANVNFLNEIARRLRELGYSTEIFERSITDPYVIVRWYTD